LATKFFPPDEERKNAFFCFRQALIYLMKSISFRASTWLPVLPEVVCVWHENPGNMRMILPPWLRVRSIEADPRAQVGETFHVQLTQFGFPMSWRGQWQRVQSPHCLEDIGLECPFAAWQHTHEFLREGEGTRMTDRVECVLPTSWGWIPGAGLAVRGVLTLMFADRHRATRAFFSRSGRPRGGRGGGHSAFLPAQIAGIGSGEKGGNL
jgi:ligand-binding SRPBCC domain-containing protein